jgi:hypothetical protein
MDDHHNYSKPLICIIIVIICTFWISEKSYAEDVSVYMVKSDASEYTVKIEVKVDVASEYLGSYDLGITFNQDVLQFQSLTTGITHGQLLPEPNRSIKDGLLKTYGYFIYFPKGTVSLLFITFKCQSNCVSLPFYLYVYGLTNVDKDLPVDTIGYEITQHTIERMQQKQTDQLPLVDQDTIDLLEHIVDIRFNQKDLFLEKINALIGAEKTTQYQSDILRLSRLSNYLNIEMNCSQVIDIINCLQVLSGLENANCRNITGGPFIGIDDVMAHFQKISFFPISK